MIRARREDEQDDAEVDGQRPALGPAGDLDRQPVDSPDEAVVDDLRLGDVQPVDETTLRGRDSAAAHPQQQAGGDSEHGQPQGRGEAVPQGEQRLVGPGRELPGIRHEARAERSTGEAGHEGERGEDHRSGEEPCARGSDLWRRDLADAERSPHEARGVGDRQRRPDDEPTSATGPQIPRWLLPEVEVGRERGLLGGEAEQRGMPAIEAAASSAAPKRTGSERNSR